MKEGILPQAVKERETFGFTEDFIYYSSGGILTTGTTGSTPTATIASGAVGGQLALYTDAVQANACWIYGTNSIYKMAAQKTFLYEAFINYTEANTNNCAIVAGFCSLASSGAFLLTNGTTLIGTLTGAIIYKLAGTTVWGFMTSVTTTQTKSVSVQTSTTLATGQANSILRIELKAVTATQYEATPIVNDQQLTDSNNRPIKQTFAFGTTAMAPVLYVMAGSSSAETVNCDRISAYELR